jgi:hypothetical protein
MSNAPGAPKFRLIRRRRRQTHRKQAAPRNEPSGLRYSFISHAQIATSWAQLTVDRDSLVARTGKVAPKRIAQILSGIDVIFGR